MTDSKRVLIVEDDYLIRETSAELLLEAGIDILEAADGEAACELLERHAMEIVALFTDIQMPRGRNGLELARLVAAEWPWISILVTSGNYRGRPPGLPQQAAYVSKPWRPEAVLGFARDALASPVH